ncbi:MAG: hypothetical protein SPF56_00365 [Bacteroidaceae bacterium]|nr:hypothetical protein [Prevotellaceae bacterium]MDY5630955.1 hypothetical protein [Bacteroidaceae bacterium]
MPRPSNTISSLSQEMGERTREIYQMSGQQFPPIVQPQEPAQPQRRRAKPQSIIPREGGKLLFLEERHNEAIEQIHWTSKVDRQDVIRAAVDEFLARHFNGDRLSEEGERLIKEYYRRTHI